MFLEMQYCWKSSKKYVKIEILRLLKIALSLGTFYLNKKKNIHTGAYRDLSCISFNGNKIITSASGGIILTNKPKYNKKIRYLIRQTKDDKLILCIIKLVMIRTN